MKLLGRIVPSAIAALLLSGEAKAMNHFGAPGAPPWRGLRTLTGGSQHCLCGWLYNNAVTAWSALENQPGGGSCQTLCSTAPAPAVPDAPANKVAKAAVPPKQVGRAPNVRTIPGIPRIPPSWNACVAYGKTSAGWQAGQAIAQESVPCEFFFPPQKTVAQWEAGYAQVGNAVKKINFFWWGNPGTPDYQKQAFEDAGKWGALLDGRGYSIDYWAQSTAPAVAAYFVKVKGTVGGNWGKRSEAYTVKFDKAAWDQMLGFAGVKERLKDGKAPDLACSLEGGAPCTVSQLLNLSGPSGGAVITGKGAKGSLTNRAVYLGPASGRKNITLKTIGAGGTFDNPGAILKGTDLAGRAADLNKVVGSLEHHRVYAAVKDLVVLAVLYRQGGFLFDSTVGPNQTADGAAAAALLTAGARSLKCPVYVTDPKAGYGATTYGTGLTDHGAEVHSIFYEVNIMYHPARNAATKNILTCVLDDWIGKHVNTGAAVNAPDALELMGQTAEAKETRNLTIGQVITSCTTRGMAKCLQDNLVEGRLAAWKGRQPDVAERGVSKLVCDQLGATKIYKGTGR